MRVPVIMWFNRRYRQWSDENLRRYNLTEQELNQLSTYNGERSRGIAHTPEWTARMAEPQRRFNGAHEGDPTL